MHSALDLNHFTVSDWKAINRNTLMGSLSLTLPSGLVIHNCLFHQKGDSRWIQLPSQSYQLNGEKKYTKILEFETKEAHARFQRAALDAVDAAGVRA